MELNKFIKFLNKENIYDQFVKNMSDFKDMCLDEYWEKTNNPENVISDAFVWTDSHEGFKFWESINTRWIIFCDDPKYGDVPSLPEYYVYWTERKIMKVFCPKLSKNMRIQIEDKMREMRPNIDRIYKEGDYLYATVKVVDKLEKRND